MKNEGITKFSSNKGFSDKLGIVSRSNFGGGGQFFSPQSLTAATLSRYSKVYEKDNDTN